MTAVPQLRIVDAETFKAAQARMERRSHEAPARARKPRHLLSGLLRCGCCGGAIVLKDRDAKGRRVYCARMHQGGGCTNGRAFYLDDITRRVVSGLEEQLTDPERLSGFSRRMSKNAAASLLLRKPSAPARKHGSRKSSASSTGPFRAT